MPLERETLLNLYHIMLTIRRFEERAAQDCESHLIPGIVHSYIGQEAVATGVCATLRREDRIVSTHRGHGHCIAKGADLKRMMAELYGKKTGYCQGKGGSMHIADFSVGMLGANGIAGAGLPIAVGAAMAAQLEEQGRVAAVFFGDGACQEGTFHESLNLAAIWKLPIIFVCENNLYGVNTPARYAIPLEDIASRAAAYAIPGVVVDGNDVMAVYQTSQGAVGRAQSGGGPTFLECKTYRWRGHAESRAFADLRPPEEVAEWKRKCPLIRMEAHLVAEGLATRAQLEEMNRQVLAQIEEAVRFAQESPFPAPEEALENVFSS